MEMQTLVRPEAARWADNTRRLLGKYRTFLHAKICVLQSELASADLDGARRDFAQRQLAKLKEVSAQAIDLRWRLLIVRRMLRRNKPYSIRPYSEVLSSCRTPIADVLGFLGLRVIFVEKETRAREGDHLLELELLDQGDFARLFLEALTEFSDVASRDFWAEIFAEFQDRATMDAVSLALGIQGNANAS